VIPTVEMRKQAIERAAKRPSRFALLVRDCVRIGAVLVTTYAVFVMWWPK
jgi:hypothetical protein